MNERKTEDIVEKYLRNTGYYDSGTDVVVEKQKSDSPRINKLLENASKKGNGAGRPEFLIHSSKHSDFLIVIECKANPRKHISPTLDKFSEFAVDGVLLYASYLSKEFNVLAIAISGEQENSLHISHYFHLKGEQKAVQYEPAKEISSFTDYYESYIHSDAKFRQDYAALLDYSRELNNLLQTRKVTEAERGFLISGILIALQNEAFTKSYRSHKTAKQLAKNLLEVIQNEFENAKLPDDRSADLMQAFSFISHSPALLEDKDFFTSLIHDINENINTFIQTHEYYDTIGQFYVEFLRYANNDKGLGIVLTPHHMAELFAELGEINKDSIVFDNCCGTAGLLIAAMKIMVKDAGVDSTKIKKIKISQLYGIEFQPKVYALAASNMVLHGDGKTNIFRGDCFEDAERLIAPKKPTVGVLNPPYKNKTLPDDKEELEFVLNNLDCLEKGGKCIAILPITCATAPSGAIGEWKKTILERHTLEAVMSMPVELFHNSKTTVVTCVMVFTAHRPHPKGKKSWFGYWRTDGFIKTKHRGRIDANDTWIKIKSKWVNSYLNREVIDGFSIMKEVTYQDEWCAEAYLETDYEKIKYDDILASSKRYILKNVMLMHEIRSNNDQQEN